VMITDEAAKPRDHETPSIVNGGGTFSTATSQLDSAANFMPSPSLHTVV